MLNKNELKNLLDRYDLRPNKLLGQNFLIDRNMQKKILVNCNIDKKDIVLEIGPGLGALTLDIASSAEKVVAVEKDRLVSHVLRSLSAAYDNIEVVSGDILKFGIKEIFKNRKIKVIGNLPYYITTPIISYLIGNRQFVDSIFITLQKEVARRLIAKPSTKDYSPLSIYTQFYTKPQYLFLITRNVFYPSPEVNSAFVKLEVLKEPEVKVKDEGFFFKVVRTAFSQRRKTILNTLATGRISNLEKKEMEALLKSLDINPNKRPEDLSIKDFSKIANSYIC